MRTRSHNERVQDRASMLTPPYEEPHVMLAHAIIELCWTVDDASERIREAIEGLRVQIDRTVTDQYANRV